jgi:hypothetical protein
VRRPGPLVVPDWCVCRNCESGLVSEEFAYGPEPLERPADGNLLVCCSQPIRDVVIDFVKTDGDSSSDEDRRDRLPGTTGRKWMIRAQMRPKPIRGATIATSIAVVKLARTMSDRLLARRRVRADTCVALANTWCPKTL